MSEPADVYADTFQVNIGPYGCSLNFSLTDSTPPPPGTPPGVNRVATIRMSMEHLKAMTYILRRQIGQFETQAHVSIPLPVEVLRGMQIREEDWQAFWQG